MPRNKITRLEIVADPEFISAVKKAAKKAGNLSVSSFIRMVVAERIQKRAKVRAAHRPKVDLDCYDPDFEFPPPQL